MRPACQLSGSYAQRVISKQFEKGTVTTEGTEMHRERQKE
jgi:hypothetical protein